MYCPKCKGRKVHQINSRMFPSDMNYRMRKYECLSCGFRFSTKESVIEDNGWDRIAYKNGLKIKRDKEQKEAGKSK